MTGIEPMLRRLVAPSVELRVEAPDGETTVSADLGQLEQVVMNLVLNARDAMPSGGVVRVRTANERVDAEHARRLPGLLPGEVVTAVFGPGGVQRPVRSVTDLQQAVAAARGGVVSLLLYTPQARGTRVVSVPLR